MDKITTEQRSRLMKQIKRANTRPELLVRKALHRRGLRFLVGDKRLPGSPDLTFPRYRAVVFVHGCFWHGHDCRESLVPKSNQEFWRAKIITNQTRDARNDAALKSQGWRVFTVWECALQPAEAASKLFDQLAERIKGLSIGT